ncbi:hypothetical protein FB45DRAFT_446095 [Roridomyces roridus]|uniref:Uncharacterized protein n=1 Tax=Roridomyces roridus TaxID=1738132 RepID=A0AAD7C108_9AGAR|nr:hypothetical protein FB45DRAFT_446095 [Roridomyces roridus]
MPALPPLLPPELEKKDFELAAYCEPRTVPRLMLVAWRVKQWVQSFLYRVVMLQGSLDSFENARSHQAKLSYPFSDNADFSRIRAISPLILRKSVHHLYMDCVPPDVAKIILSTCHSVHNLWISLRAGNESSIVEMAGHLPLRRLYCFIDELFGREAPIDFNLPIFSHLTHLELFSMHECDLSEWAGIATIPHLTHFAFDEVALLPLAATVLQRSRSLRVLIMCYGTLEGHPEAELLRQDVRFVQLDSLQYRKDWRAGALGASDYWARAEEVVTARTVIPWNIPSTRRARERETF